MTGRFLPGHPGGPGRPKGPCFLTRLRKLFEENEDEFAEVARAKLAEADPRFWQLLMQQVFGQKLRLEDDREPTRSDYFIPGGEDHAELRRHLEADGKIH